MIKIILTKGTPASGKSYWTKSEVAKDPLQWCRINNDAIRAMCNDTVFSTQYEELITATRSFLIREAIKKNLNVIVDNVHADNYHFKQVCKIAQEMNKDIEVSEKCFYIDLNEAIARDKLRVGKEQVGEKVIEKFYKKLGGEAFKSYQPKIETLYKRTTKAEQDWKPLEQNKNNPKAIIMDNDGTIALIGDRSPYDASNCDLVDVPHEHVIEVMRLYYQAGYKIIFVSGRQEKDRAPTERFYQKHFPDIKEYLLYMRATNDMRSDVIIKEEIFNNHIKNNYYVAAWFDDRLKVCKWVYQNSLPLFRVNDPESSF